MLHPVAVRRQGCIKAIAATVVLCLAAVLPTLAMAQVRKPGPPVTATAAMTYLTRAYPEPLPLSLVEPVITDKGIKGAEVALSDNQTTGRLLGHAYTLSTRIVAADADIAAAMRDVLASGSSLIVADLEAADLLAVADIPEAKDALIINTRSSNDDLRGKSCRRNVFHAAPSWAMRADALSQYLTWKQWRKLFVVYGENAADQEYVAAIKRAAKRFGNKIVDERKFTFDAGNRRTDTGHQQIQTQMPLLTQGPPEHDLIFVADLDEAFGEYLMWRTSVAKPVIGTQGLMALAWHRAFEQYGGTQLQSRFEKHAKRQMIERDYLGWLGTRLIGEAITRIGQADAASVRAFLLSPEFEVAGFKGQGMTFRTWDRQLRQPILLTGPRALVSISPQEGFLHPKFLTDTLGFDEAETQCTQRN